MSTDVPRIGRCIGCDQPARLDDGVCEACLTRRGRRWAEMSNRCRTEPAFALAVYARIQTDRGRELFLRMYGRTLLVAPRRTIAEARERLAKSRPRSDEELTIPPPRGRP